MAVGVVDALERLLTVGADHVVVVERGHVELRQRCEAHACEILLRGDGERCVERDQLRLVLVGALLAAGGTAVVVVLTLRAMGEWRTIQATRPPTDATPGGGAVRKPPRVR